MTISWICKGRWCVFLTAALLFASPLDAWPRIIEEKRWVPASVQHDGLPYHREIMVTVFYDDQRPAPYPLLVLSHGRAVEAAERHALGRASYYEAAKWFAERGFLVAVPTRIGYGVTGGRDIEDTGACGKKDYRPGYAAAADQALAAMNYLRGWKEVDKTRTVIAGQSFGGTSAIGIAARNPPGVQAAINFAGGGGGRPKTHPMKPCGPEKLAAMFAEYGKTARVPTLWIYSQNDMYSGPVWPKRWFKAYKDAGGTGEFQHYPAYGDDGHGIFTKSPDWWKPRVLEFLRANGYPGI